jgi:hypothetical protein
VLRPMTEKSPRTKKERAKISSAKEINVEIARLYRRHANKDLSAAELKSRVGALTALRAGLPETVAPLKTGSTWTSPPTILSVPSGCFLTMEQIAAHKRGEDIVDPALCEPFVFEDAPPPPRSVVPFPRLVSPANERRVEEHEIRETLIKVQEVLKALEAGPEAVEAYLQAHDI